MKLYKYMNTVESQNLLFNFQDLKSVMKCEKLNQSSVMSRQAFVDPRLHLQKYHSFPRLLTNSSGSRFEFFKCFPCFQNTIENEEKGQLLLYNIR